MYDINFPIYLISDDYSGLFDYFTSEDFSGSGDNADSLQEEKERNLCEHHTGFRFVYQ